MSINQELITALVTLDGFSKENVVPDVYTGTKNKFIAFNIADERGVVCDDSATENVISIQVHLFLPLNENYFNIKDLIKTKLVSIGYSYPVVSQMIDDDKRHLIFECEKVI